MLDDRDRLPQSILRGLERPLLQLCLDALDAADTARFVAAVTDMTASHLRFVRGFRTWADVVHDVAVDFGVPAPDQGVALGTAAALNGIDPARVDEDRVDALRDEALAAGTADAPRARAACRELSTELRLLHAVRRDAVTLTMGELADTAGLEALSMAFRVTAERSLVHWMQRDVAMSPYERLETWSHVLRANFSTVAITEESDRFVLAQQPCGTCGSQIEAGLYPTPLTCLRPSPGSTWGGTPMPIYRAHIDVMHHVIPLEQIGAPWPVWECVAQPGDHPRCRVHLYKDPVDPAASARLQELRADPFKPLSAIDTVRLDCLRSSARERQREGRCATPRPSSPPWSAERRLEGRDTRVSNISDILRLGAGRWPDQEAVVHRDRRSTYAAIARLAGGAVAMLAEAGVRPGDSVVTVGGNSDLLLAACTGVFAAGGVLVPLNPMSTVDEAAEIVRRTGSTVIVHDGPYAGFVAELAAELGDAPRRIVFDSASGEVPWQPAPLQPAVTGGEDVAMVIFTSGSTGRPKGCVKTHAGLLAHVAHTQITVPRLPTDRELFVVPLSGIGLVNHALPGLTVGAVLHVEKFDAAAVLQTLQQERITTSMMAPTMLHALLSRPEQEAADLAALRRIETGYEISPRLRTAIAERFGPIVWYGYGTSEGSCSWAAPEHFLTDPSCVGRPNGLDEIVVRDADGRPVPEGVTGEITVCGPTVLREYLGDPELTAATLQGGWFHTGDLGWMGPGSMLHFAGRIKDMIKTGGSNVAAAEVEQAIARLSSVSNCAVVGVPDDRWGEAVVAVVVPEPGASLTEADLVAHARESLAGYKRPKRYLLVDELPLNPGGKVAKGVVRELVLESVRT